MLIDTETTEQYLLSCIINEPKLWDNLEFIIKDYHFQSAKSKKLFTIFQKWSSVANVKDKDEFISYISLEYSIWVKANKKFIEEVLSRIVYKEQAIEKWETYFVTLEKVHQNSKLMDILNGMMIKMGNKPLDVALNLQEVINDLSDVNLSLQSQEALYSLQSIVDKKLENINLRLSKDFSSSKFGLSSLDELFGGYFPNTYNIITGRSSQGKSAFMKTLVRNMIDREGKKIAVFNLEMANSDFIDRFASAHLKINSSLFKDPKYLSPEQLKAYKNYIMNDFDKKYNDKLFLVDDIFDIKQILQKILYFYNTYKIDGVFIDLIEYMSPDKDGFATEQLKIQYLSNELFKFRKQIPIFITILQHMNKSGDAPSADGSNQKSLRGAEDTYLQSDSTIIIFPSKDEDKQIDPESRLILVDKNRHGGKGSIKLGYKPEHTHFYDNSIVTSLT